MPKKSGAWIRQIPSRVWCLTMPLSSGNREAGSMGSSVVFFRPVVDSRDITAVQYQFRQLLKKSDICRVFRRGDFVPIKMHFGEKGNTGYVRAPVVKSLVDRLKSFGAKPFVTDTNVLYPGARTNAVDHLSLAEEHGFSAAALGCPVLIADGLFGENAQEVPLSLKHFQSASIARPFTGLESLASIAHVTGHVLTGFAATLKNLGMGMASRAGKYRQHAGIAPQIIAARCTRCGRCLQICPAAAIREQEDAVRIDTARCAGCAACVVACGAAAVRLDFSA
ncbi:MAG: DUF362 domain-containing protein, partial [Candidatus Omnitrophica bacterium]|nr:DUF362 domain-containing protein [Candidatus Omnitrophota bacterium]